VTKTFTVTALMQLAEKGELSLDDPIETYVPGMPNGSATLRQLAEMRSGIPSYTFDQSFQDTVFSDPNHVWTPQELVDLVKGEAPMFAPGTMTFYSNTNLVLLGMAIEKVTGAPIAEVMKGADLRAPRPRPHDHADRRRLPRAALAGLHDAGRRR
jgi:D-alanyl-D-alanine carboxypeptidase